MNIKLQLIFLCKNAWSIPSFELFINVITTNETILEGTMIESHTYLK